MVPKFRVWDETQEAGSVTFTIHYCPMCGRKLQEETK